jgi:hypothetical protein
MVLYPIGFSVSVFERAASNRKPSAEDGAHLSQLPAKARRIQEWLNLTFTDPTAAASDPPYFLQQAIADALFSIPGLHGLKYPTTRHRVLGNDNVALSKEFVDQSLKLVGGSMHRMLALSTSGATTRKLATLASIDDNRLTWDHHFSELPSLRVAADTP